MEEAMYFPPTLEDLEDEVQHVGEKSAEAGASMQEEKVESNDTDPHIVGTLYKVKRCIIKLKHFVSMERCPTKTQMSKSIVLPLSLLSCSCSSLESAPHGTTSSAAAMSPILSSAPYNRSTGTVGLIYIGPRIGVALGSIWAGVTADRLTSPLCLHAVTKTSASQSRYCGPWRCQASSHASASLSGSLVLITASTGQVWLVT